MWSNWIGAALLALAVSIGSALSAQSGLKNLAIVDTQVKSKRPPAVMADLQPMISGGKVTLLTIKFRTDSRAKRKSARLLLESQDWQKLSVALKQQGKADADTLKRYATVVARQTYCRTGPIGLNRKGRAYTSAADIAAILEQNGVQIIGGTIPSTAKGKAIPPIHYETFGLAGWVVRLTCNAPNPY